MKQTKTCNCNKWWSIMACDKCSEEYSKIDEELDEKVV